MTEAERVVIVGGGFGGLSLINHLRSSDYAITLIEKTNHHLFQPLLYEVVSASLGANAIASPLRELLKPRQEVTILLGEVERVDPEKKLILLKSQERIPFDILVLAPGTKHGYFGKDQWATLAPGLKTVEDAIFLKNKCLNSLESAERMQNSKEALPHLQFAIIGAGPTGVELAGSLSELFSKTLRKNFRFIKPENCTIFLVEAVDQILPSYPVKLAKKAQKMLQKRGVQILLGKKVEKISPEGVLVGDKFIPTHNVIWAAGTQGPSLFASLPIPLDKQGRAFVEEDLSIKEFPFIFVIGDAAHYKIALPAVAQVAIQGGRYVAKLLKNRLKGVKSAPFKYHDKGNMAVIAKGAAVVSTTYGSVSGWIAWLMWAVVHIFYLRGKRNRFLVLFEWLCVLISKKRGNRIIDRG